MMITYFGYGSLVNVETIPAETEVTPGRLRGWVREWKVCGNGSNGQGRCALTVREQDGSEIRGVMATEPGAGLHELEKREKRYRKVHNIGQAFRCEPRNEPGPETLFLFKAAPAHNRWGTETHPILQSYLDCVLAGFFRIWGEEGIDHFLTTTNGWHVPVLRDRDKPHYPRSVELRSGLAAMIDDKLDALGLNFLD